MPYFLSAGRVLISYIGYRQYQPWRISRVLQECHQDLRCDYFLSSLMARMTSLRVGSSFEMLEAALADVDSFELRQQSKERYETVNSENSL